MRILRYTIFAFAWLAGMSVSAFAQGDQKDPPPKKDPPVVVVKEKDKEKPKEKPKDDNRGTQPTPGKPEVYFDPESGFLK